MDNTSNSDSNQALRSALQQIVVDYPDRGEHFDSGFSEGCYLVSEIKQTIKRMDEGQPLAETLHALAGAHAPLHPDGEDRYGYGPVRHAMNQAGLLEQFDEMANPLRLARQHQQEEGPGVGARLRRVLFRR